MQIIDFYKAQLKQLDVESKQKKEACTAYEYDTYWVHIYAVQANCIQNRITHLESILGKNKDRATQLRQKKR